MIIYDFEVTKHNWILCWLDCKTKKMHFIHDNKSQMEKFYEHYKDEIWVGYNSRGYDQWIAKAILCDFNPYEMSHWIINKERKGFEFSKLLNKFPVLNYDCSVGFRSLKELEAFMGDSIVESSIPWDINRPLTQSELKEMIDYCFHDVWETFKVFVETKEEFESHLGLIKEFGLPLSMISKTKAQISAEILGASFVKRNDEFDIKIPDNMILGKYEYIKDHFVNWSKNIKDYDKITLNTTVADVPTVCGIGGLHSSKDNYIGDGNFLMVDVASYYPAGMIEYDFLSRNVRNKAKFKAIRDERLVMKANKDKRQAPRKIVLNGTFGASKDKYNKLYDPLQANNLCISCQLFLVDLAEKLENHCQIIQKNTDGILMKLYDKANRQKIVDICHEWEKRTRFELEFDDYVKVIQSNVNNYIIIDANGNVKRKGAIVKNLNPLDNDLPIINKAVVDYFVHNINPRKTILECDELIQFQKVTKISLKYEYGMHNGKKLHEKVHRCFASKYDSDGTLYKKHRNRDTLDKTASTPERCRIVNTEVNGLTVPDWLDKQWYIELAERRVREFVK